MKMKKLLALIMTGAMTLSLAACGSSPAPTGASEGSAGETETTQGSGSSETTTIEDEKSATASGIKIHQNLISGGSKSYFHRDHLR